MKKLFVLFFFFISPIPSLYAQSAELGIAYQNKVDFTKAKDYDQAVVWGEKTITLAEKEFGKTSAQFANYATDLASLYQLKNDLEKAEKWYSVAYKIYLDTYGEVHAYTSVTAFNLGLVYESQKKDDKAELFYLKALNGYEKSLGREHDYYKMALNYLIKFYNKTLQYSKEEKYILVDLEIVEKKSGKTDEYAVALINKGLNYYNSQNYGASETTFLEAVKLLESLSKKESDDYFNACGFVYQLYNTTGEFEKAVPYMKIYASFVQKRSGKDSKEYAILLSYEGEVYRNLTMYGEAEKCFMEALYFVEKKEGTNNENYASLINNLGYLYKLMGQYEKSEKYLLQSLSVYENVFGKKATGCATVLNNLGLLKTSQGKYESAEAHYLEAVSIQKNNSGKSDDSYGSTLNNLGLLYSYMGQYSRALDLLDEALVVKEKTIGINHPEYANTLVNIANIHSDKGNYVQAEKLYKQSQHIYKKSVGISDLKYANILTNLGQLCYLMGQYDKALVLHLQALDIKAKALGKEHNEYAISLNFIGICYLNEGKLDQAKNIFTEALNLKKKALGSEHPDIIMAMSNLALVELKKDNYQKAASMLEECVAMGKKNLGENNLTYATYLNNLGSVYLMQRNYSKAAVHFLQSKNIREKFLNKNHIHLAEVNSNLGHVYEEMGDLTKAEPYYLQANEVYYLNIRNQFPFMSEKDKEAFFLNFKGYINNFYTFCVNRSIDNPSILEAMYNNQLNYKALLLNETKQLVKYMQSPENGTLRDLYDKWINQREYLAKVYSLDKTDIEKRGIDINKEEEKVNELEKDFAGKSDFFARTTGSKIFTWKDVKKSLRQGEAAIEIININSYLSDSSSHSTYVALIVSLETKKYPRLVLLDKANESEDKYFTYFINSIKLKKEDIYSYDRYWSLLKNGLDKEGAISKVYLSADGVYNKLSLNGLMNPSTKVFLCDEVDVHLLSNTKLLVERKVENGISKLKNCELYGFPDYSNNDVLTSDNSTIQVSNGNVADTLSRYFTGGVIPDLPGTEVEVLEISKILKLNGVEPKVYLRKKATEERLKSTESPDILHIATHGFFMKDDPLSREEENMSAFEIQKLKQNPLLRSGLLLAGVRKSFVDNKDISTGEDGIFTAYEAMNLDLRNTQLVVLSACETGLGEIKNGEGVYGLQRALEISGAEAILMSLWNVNDEATQELMVLFYREWMATGNKKASFNKARQMVREKYKDPYYWAAFVFIGE